jgi:hypothetical protein
MRSLLLDGVVDGLAGYDRLRVRDPADPNVRQGHVELLDRAPSAATEVATPAGAAPV